MQTDLVHELSRAIFREQVLLNWRFYAVLLLVLFIACFAANWLGSYFQTRAKTFATKADMDEILRQVAATTRATEEVRSAISQADWVAREWRTTRRIKLEELMATAYSLEHWLDLQREKWLHGEAVDVDNAPMHRLKLLGALFFPELKAEVITVWLAHQTALAFIFKIGRMATDSGASTSEAAHEAAVEEFLRGWEPLFSTAVEKIIELETKASSLMVEIAKA
jgi:hypothetical protein